MHNAANLVFCYFNLFNLYLITINQKNIKKPANLTKPEKETMHELLSKQNFS